MRPKKIIILGAIAFVLSGLFPPWVHTRNYPDTRSIENPAGYRLIFDPPPAVQKSRFAGVQIDRARLLIQWAIIGAIVAGVVVLRRKD